MQTRDPSATKRNDDPASSIEAARTLSMGSTARPINVALAPRPTSDALPAHIGRFRVLRQLGAGGMGEVYLCQDDSLGRRIAVKRVRGADSASAQERLRREARALAKFSHDNIVQVHEIGDHEGNTFIAMELVEGQTLTEWLAASERSWMDICDHFLVAGRGLAAAHVQDIVHRDFKPDNVLVRASDGRVKVADFGLVLDELADELEARLVVGTPRYMSPEQMRGEHCDARSDQFSFCVALYEAVWAALPFTAAKLHDRLRQIDGGEVAAVSSHRALFCILQRGLASDPDQRWPSMDALLSVLEGVRYRRRRRRRWAAGTLSVVASIGLSFVVHASLASPALNCGADLAGVWDPSTQARLELHLGSLEARHAQASSERLLASLGRWASAWSSEHTQLCEQLSDAPDLEQVQRSSAHTTCLLRQRARVAELVGAVAQGDAAVLADALVAAARLPAPEDCANPRASVELEPPPPMLASAVDGVRADLERVRTQRVLGKLEQARAQAQAVLTIAVEFDYVPLEAEVRAELAKIEAESGEAQRAASSYDEAIHLAESARHDQLAAELLLERVELSLHQLPGDRSVGLRLEQAVTALERIDAKDSLRARSIFAAGRLAERSRDHVLAKQRYVEAITRAGDEAPELPYYLTALATVTTSAPHRLELHTRALELVRERLGPHHPRTAQFLYNHGLELLAAGLEHEAEAELRLANELWSESLVPTHKLRAKIEQRLAMAALIRGELDVAEGRALEAARILDEHLPATAPERGEPASILAQLAATRADLDQDARQTLREQAIFHAQRAIRLLESRASELGPDSALSRLHQLLGNQYMSLGRFGEAEQAFARAADLSEDQGANAIISLRRAELALRRDELADAALHLDAVTAQVAEIGAEGLSYALLRAVVDLRLGRLDEHRLAELRDARREFPSMEPTLGPWLDELGLDGAQRAQLGF